MTPDEKLELVCYLKDGWKPLIRPASPRRDWMDATPESFAYRCLPLNIANAHGWEVLNACAFEASWNGGTGTDAVTVSLPAGADPVTAPVSIFGQGVLTFHVAGLFRTPPGWNLWVGGSPNQPKDGVAPLGGVIETDWSPFTFTMNWRFTRPDNWVRFEAGEAICFLFPVRRDLLDRFTTRFASLSEQPELAAQFDAWAVARDAFHEQMRANPPATPSDKWQKHYYRGVDPSEQAHVADHRTKLRVAPFAWNPQMGAAPTPSAAVCPASRPPPSPAEQRVAELTAELARARLALARRDWMLDVAEGHRRLAPAIARIEKRAELGREAFLQRHYAAGRPVVVTGLAPTGEGGGPLADYVADGATAKAWTAAFEPLAQSLANVLLVQTSGRRTFRIAPPSETWRLYATADARSAVIDLDQRERLEKDFPLAARARVYDIPLESGEALFLPIGWWRQARAEAGATTLAFEAFPWPNNAGQAFPRG
jgi:hypothetical protein